MNFLWLAANGREVPVWGIVGISLLGFVPLGMLFWFWWKS